MWNCKFPHVSTVMWPSPLNIELCGGSVEELERDIATIAAFDDLFEVEEKSSNE
jgi:hypothetical protein